MDRIIGVVTTDYRYAKRFCDYINRSGRLNISAVPFESVKSCSDYGKKHRIELLIADRSLLEDEGQKPESIKAVKKIMLAEDTEGIRQTSEDGLASFTSGIGPVLDKYQSAEQLLGSIENSIDDNSMFRPRKRSERRTTVLGVYSPVKRCGKTLFALTLCREMSRKSRVLYINLEEFPPILKLFGDETRTEGISEAVYSMKQGGLNEKSIRKFITSSAGMDWMAPVTDPDDESFINGEDYTALINAVFDYTDYEYLIIDMNRYSGQADIIIDMCSMVYMPGGNDCISRIKMESFMKYAADSKNEKWLKKLRQISLPREPLWTETGTYLDKLLYGEMGDFARELSRI